MNILNASYCLDLIEVDIDHVMNVSCSEHEIAKMVQEECCVSDGTAFFDSEEDAKQFLRLMQASTWWLASEKTSPRGTLRIVGYELHKIISDEDGEASEFERTGYKFEPFVGHYKNEREFWKKTKPKNR